MQVTVGVMDQAEQAAVSVVECHGGSSFSRGGQV
jgi:hypothetical protein